MSEKSRFDHDFDIITSGEYDGPNRFDRMIKDDYKGLHERLTEGCTLHLKGGKGVIEAQLLESNEKTMAKGVFNGVLSAVFSISDCFLEGSSWDLVYEALETPFEVDGTRPSIEDDERSHPLDDFLKTSPSGTLSLSLDSNGLFEVSLSENRPPKQERRGGRVLTYGQIAWKRGRGQTIYEALAALETADETISSNLIMAP